MRALHGAIPEAITDEEGRRHKRCYVGEDERQCGPGRMHALSLVDVIGPWGRQGTTFFMEFQRHSQLLYVEALALILATLQVSIV